MKTTYLLLLGCLVAPFASAEPEHKGPSCYERAETVAKADVKKYGKDYNVIRETETSEFQKAYCPKWIEEEEKRLGIEPPVDEEE